MTKCNAIIMNIVSILSKWHNFRLNSYCQYCLLKTSLSQNVAFHCLFNMCIHRNNYLYSDKRISEIIFVSSIFLPVVLTNKAYSF